MKPSCSTIFTILLVSVLLTSFGCSSSPDSWSLRYSQTNTADSAYTLNGHIPYARSIERATGGRVSITVTGPEALQSTDQILGDVKAGRADIGWLYTGLYPGQFSFVEVSTLPYLYPDAVVGARVTWELFARYPELQSQFRDVKVLALWITEPYFIAGKSRFYRTLDDFPGQRIRAAVGPPSDFVRALGGTPVLVSRIEVNQKFQNDEIGAALLPSEAYLAFKTYEVAPYLTRVSTVATVEGLVMNLDVWNRFPKEVQDQIMSVSGEVASVHFGTQVYDASRLELQAFIKTSGKIQEYTPPTAELQRWIDRSGTPVWDAWVQTQEAKGLANARQILDDALARSRQYGGK